ncbi:mechanosensitive ion channel [Ruegeria pomeroyi]|uniref:Mechanosensitive ion channel n=2 Tax=Ruegeria TaxID=97050 RepID=A0A9Q3WLR3_9RHOB|nr:MULTISPECIES: mechanosensitive ion channel domain-containing protein [Ruegeria]MCE8514665.1 mechanosensitive ion channel [Ruegeria pomeroyi]MCE8531362.1 mechanosensitive ion channel [Ruegeria pomeroyi]MCE8538084.1 mechanosensitive ion channel [Ruegeria pomeroyi]MCG6560213.1 mechanosensitive ion channel [Ruegeria alba]
MNEDILPATLDELIATLLTEGHRLVGLFLTPGWRQYQLLIIALLIGAALLLSLLTRTHWDAWARSREGWPKWRLRTLVLLMRRLSLLYFVALSWLTYLVMQQMTWPSRSYVIGVVATLATALLVIALVARAVRNRTIRLVFRWSMWVYATLVALNLTDDVARFLDGISIEIGALHISVLGVMKAVLLVGALLVLVRLASQGASNALARNDDISPSMQVLLAKAVQVLLYGWVFIVAIRTLGFDLTGLAFLSGAIGVGIGFGLQKVVSNLISGIIILMDRSIKPGDVISLGETFGWINALGARYVSVVTRDGREYLIPNEDLITSQVVNWSHSDQFVRLDLNFGTSYGDDPHKVRAVAIAAARSVGRVLAGSGRDPVCHIVGFGDSSVDYVLRFWITDPTAGLTNIRGNVFLALWDAFQAEGISIPFPQREVRMLEDAATPVPAAGQGGAD